MKFARTPSRRAVVAGLGAGAAGLAFTVGAVSLTRFAGDFLGFPPGLEWTFTGAVDVAGIAGAVMWTGFNGPVRQIGRPMSIVCTTVSGLGVGLDHATHAGRALRETGGADWLAANPVVWAVVAFLAGAFIPALVTWILHALAVMADNRETSSETREDTVSATVTHREVAPRGADREAAALDREEAPALVAATVTPHREVSENNVEDSPGAGTSLPGPRAPWMTPAVIDAVRSRAAAAAADGRQYGGEGSIFDDRFELPALPDGSVLSQYKARELAKYLRKHGLIEVAA